MAALHESSALGASSAMTSLAFLGTSQAAHTTRPHLCNKVGVGHRPIGRSELERNVLGGDRVAL